MVAELNLGKCNRLMFQKPLAEEAPSLAELSAKHRFCLFPDQEFTSQRIDFVLEDDTFLKITHNCINSYLSGDESILSNIRVGYGWN